MGKSEKDARRNELVTQVKEELKPYISEQINTTLATASKVTFKELLSNFGLSEWLTIAGSVIAFVTAFAVSRYQLTVVIDKLNKLEEKVIEIDKDLAVHNRLDNKGSNVDKFPSSLQDSDTLKTTTPKGH